MKKWLMVFTLGTAVLLNVACKRTKDTVQQEAPAAPGPVAAGKPLEEKEEQGVRPVRIDAAFRPGNSDPFDLSEAVVRGDTLFLTVGYGGGCKEHVFDLVTNKMFLKSMPPQLVLTLEHESNDDMCRAYLTETLRFDLTGIRYAGSSSVRLRINGEGGKEVMYTY